MSSGGLARVARALLAAGLVLAATAPQAAAKKKEKPAATPAASGDTSEVLVRVGGGAITRSDVQKRLDDLPEGVRANFTTPEGRQQLLDRMVEERVWLEVARRAGVEDRPKVQQQLDQQRRDFLIRTYLTELMATKPAPTDSQAKIYYDAHLDEYKIPASAAVRHIQLPSALQAKRVLALARAGEDWNKLCLRYSTDSLTRANGGYLGSVTHEGQFPVLGKQPALAESAFALGSGKIGGPWRIEKTEAEAKPGAVAHTQITWQVIKVDEVHADSERPFDSVRSVIIRQLGQQQSQEFYRSHFEGARHDLGVSPDSAAIKRFTSQKKDAHEQFREAQELGPPDQRLAAYRRIVDEFPNDDVSPQAAFMMGFICSEELKNYDEAEKAFRLLLARYPKSELAPSAQWMLDHMRSQEAPSFIESQVDSLGSGSGRPRSGGAAGRP
jgi:tetratricopeptide (TPR) repeat protein